MSDMSNMRNVFRACQFYIFMLFLLLLNVIAISPYLIYFIYAIIIAAVFLSGNDIRWGNRLFYGLVLGSTLITVIFLLELKTGLVAVSGLDFSGSLLLSVIVLQILVATGEELAFRSYILNKLIKDIGMDSGIFYSSLMFAAIHIPSTVYYGLDTGRIILVFVVVGMLGAIASFMYLEYGLLAAVGFHFSWNFLQYNIFSLASTQEGILKSNYIDSGLVTGGNFGPEAGIIGFIVIFIVTVFILKIKYRTKIK